MSPHFTLGGVCYGLIKLGLPQSSKYKYVVLERLNINVFRIEGFGLFFKEGIRCKFFYRHTLL